MNSIGKPGFFLAMAVCCVVGAASISQPQAIAQTAWDGHAFRVDVANVIARSNIILAAPNTLAKQAMPLGNGSLGAAVWSANGLTAQLNRADTLPYRYATGWVEVPGLVRLVKAKDYSGCLDLYNGEFRESGGGMTTRVFIPPHTDSMVIDVTGADPEAAQTVTLSLWPPRTPQTLISGHAGALYQSWIDNKAPGASGRPFGSFAALSAEGRDVVASVASPRTITLAFKPFQDGHFLIVVASPHFDGGQDVHALLASAQRPLTQDGHQPWWHRFWSRAGTVKVSSPDGSGEYMENLRDIYLYGAAAEKGKEYPGTQAGVADMFSSGRDAHHWDSSAFWHWNLRMQVAANLGAGLPDLNAPYFNLYRENLSTIERWTAQHMDGRPGACVPETMRFNGVGIEYEPNWPPNRPSLQIAHDCDAAFQPYANSRTLSTGAEVSLWVWQQYLATGDRRFLAANYPIMAASARFLLAYQKLGPDGRLHTSPSNAHETQWDVTDPTTDISAALALYPATIEAAGLLGRDADLVRRLKTALTQIPPYPRALIGSPNKLVGPEADARQQDIIVDSYLPATINHNVENIGLEPVWPYGIIEKGSPLFSLELRTYTHRPYPSTADWSFDPIQAARLGLGKEVGKTLVSITEKYQDAINGFANWDRQYGEFYIEQDGVVATALQEALVQDEDGTIVIAPAIPPGWDFDGSVYVRGNTKVDVQVRRGVPTTVVIEAGSTQNLRVANPWPGRRVEIVSGTGARVASSRHGSEIIFAANAGSTYLMYPVGHAVVSSHFVAVTGTPARSAKRLGRMQIGLFAESAQNP